MNKKKRIAVIISSVLGALAFVGCVVGMVLAIIAESNNHTYEDVVDVKYLMTAADCEHGAIYYKSCWCGKVSDEETFEYGEPLGHDYGTLIEEDPATCTESGVKAHYHCSRCAKDFDDSKQEITVAELVIPAKGHDYGTWIDGKPATETDNGEKGHYHCSDCGKNFDNDDGKTEIEDIIIPPTVHVHNYSTVTYEWDTTYTSCTATRICGECSHKETVNGTVGAAITQQLTCTANELTTYTATFTESWCAAQTETLTTALAPGHNFGTTTYVWDSNHTCCMAIRVCVDDGNHVERTMSAMVTSNVTQKLSCTVDEQTTYTATFGKSWCATQIETVTTATAQGHVYQNIVKAELFVSAATCASPAKYYKSCTCGAQSTDTFEYGSTLNHTYGATTYAWDSNHTTCTATHTCTNSGCTHTETANAETANGTITSQVTQQQTCTDDEKTTYTATFAESWCTTQTDVATTATALNHAYGATTYAWDSNHTTCTATHTCTNNGCTHTETANAETANGTITSQVTQQQTCTDDEQTTYTATFAESWCTTQTDVAITATALNHTYGATTYVWDSNHATCTATHTCINGGCTHEETANAETANGTITSQVTQQQTCTDDEQTTYTATFTESWCTTQTDVATTVAALGHDYGTTTYAWDSTYSACTAEHTCTRSGCNYTETAKATVSTSSTAAGCTVAATVVYTATFGNDWCKDQTQTVVGVVLGHSYGATAYVWSSDNSTCTATRTCGRSGCTYSESKTVTTKASVTQSKTCVLPELSTITATYSGTSWCQEQTKTGVKTAEPAGHTYGAWVNEVAATCTTTGTAGYYQCSVCNAYFDVNKKEISGGITIAALGHDYSAFTSIGDGTHSGACVRSGCSYTGVEACTSARGKDLCDHCGEPIYSQNLIFILRPDKSGEYTLKGIGTCTDTTLVIPKINVVDGVAGNVAAVYDGAFSGNKQIECLVFGSYITVINAKAFNGCTNLTEIYFMGTQTEFDAITIKANNTPITSATIYYYSATKPSVSGNYWRYVNGCRTVWNV